ncbi:hypothetical protein QQP08_015178 [Theobroma cacao]|nr:hypothetical protein QQP08_015178 [Theobroma cacao]
MSSPGLRIPHSVAIALAVKTLSPVIILMFTPAYWQSSTAFITPDFRTLLLELVYGQKQCT